MANWIEDLYTMKRADPVRAGRNRRAPGVRGTVRIARRMLNRCLLDRDVIGKPRVFCLNSGGCGSTYVVSLLQANGIEKCFHEREPDLNRMGVLHYDNQLSGSRMVRLIRYTRHDSYFESSNRLFSFAPQLKAAFPRAGFIHLHRHAADAVRSAMSKPDVQQYLQTGIRFTRSLAGPKQAPPFERFCHYWANVNGRILDDLDRMEATADSNGARWRLSLRFSDLVAGKVDELESFLDAKFKVKKLPPANVGAVRNSGRFSAWKDWSRVERDSFEKICGEVLTRLGYPIETG